MANRTHWAKSVEATMMRGLSLVLGLIALVHVPAPAFKFLCNGIEADGKEVSDNCGVCTNDSAPRWTPVSII